MDSLSPETRDLLARAEGGDDLPAVRRLAIRGRIAGALGVALPLASARMTAAAHGKHSWLRGSSSWGWWPHVLGAVGIASAVSVAPIVVSARLAHRARAPGPAIETPVVVVTTAPEEPARVDPPSDLGPAIASAIVAPAAVPRIERAAVVAVPSSSSRRVLRAPLAPSAAAPSAAPAPAGRFDLAAEAQILAKAQAALGAGQAAEALTLLDEHDARFPNGTLAPESGELRVRALCASGRTDEARAQAERLHARFPSVVPASPCGTPAR